MKITSVEIFDVTGDAGWFIWHPIIVRINTDEGISGLGEVSLAYGSGHSAGAAMVKNLAEQFCIGADPMKTEKIWDTMFTTSFWGLGGGPVVYGGMSAIDIALWDIKGKAVGLPVYQLLGGKTNETLRTYASQIQFGWGKENKNINDPKEYGEESLKAVAEGYDCIKVDPFYFDTEGNLNPVHRGILTPRMFDMACSRVRAVREAIGSGIDIIVELHSSLGVPSAIQLGKALEEFNCMYCEEPVNYVNAELQAKVSTEVNIPMAAGERLYTRWGYRPYFEKQSLAMIQPDVGLVGGITEAKKVCDYAHIYDIGVQFHVCGSPVGNAAALQLEAAIPNFIIHEHHTISLKEFNIRLCKQDYQPSGGQFEIPDLPGLGIELNDNDPQIANAAKMVVTQ